MLDWFRRYRQRQRDLAAGVDADLLQSNRRKRRIASWLIGVGLLLAGIDSKLHAVMKEMVGIVGVIFFFAGGFLLRWVWQESWFLNKPDPKEPPSLFK